MTDDDLIDNDHWSLRACWLIAAFDAAGFNPETRARGPRWRNAAEASFNVLRPHPATHWRTGVKLVSVIPLEPGVEQVSGSGYARQGSESDGSEWVLGAWAPGWPRPPEGP